MTSLYKTAFFLALFMGQTFVPVSVKAESSPFTECREKNPEWYGCTTDEDCVSIYNPCGWRNDSSNKLSADKAEECNRHVGAALSCAEASLMMSDEYHPECDSGTCIAVRNK